jgi:hypothetical protein
LVYSMSFIRGASLRHGALATPHASKSKLQLKTLKHMGINLIPIKQTTSATMMI